ncbi:hypothetical protein JCM9534A_29860 [Catenuloplanes indicus JCM 9534]
MANATAAAPELEAAAISEAGGRLGEKLRTHYHASLPTWQFIVVYPALLGGVVVLIGGGGLGGLLGGASVGVPLAILGAALLAGSIIAMLVLPKRRTAMVIFENGFARALPGAVDVVPWTEVQDLYISITRTYIHTQNNWRIDHLYTVERAGRPDIVLLSGWTDTTELAEALETGVARAKLPAAQQALAAGGEVPFKDFTVRADGLIWSGTLTPWSQITGVERSYDDAKIQSGGRTLVGFSYGKLTNARLFLSLVQHLRG